MTALFPRAGNGRESPVGLRGWGKDGGLLPSVSYLRGELQAQHNFLIPQEQGVCYGKMLHGLCFPVASWLIKNE